MSFPEVSVIIPIYNSENVLERCIDSVLCQSYKDFELLLINDGSTDSSGAICDDYAKKDNRIKVIHQANGGPSKARNTGLSIATGAWICFVDSDDWVEPEYIYGFLGRPNAVKEELIIQGFYDVYLDNDEKVITKKKHRFYDLNEVDIQNVKGLIVYNQLHRDGYPFCKLYNTQVIRENEIRFDQQISFAEDTLFLLKYLQFIKKMYFANDCAYNHTINASSLSCRYYDYKTELWCYEQISQLLDLFKHRTEQEINAEIASYAGSFLVRAINSMYRTNTKLKRNDRLQKIESLYASKNIECYLAYSNSFFGKLPAFTFKNKMFVYMDLVLCFQFRLRYSFAFLWHLWLRVKRWVNIKKVNRTN